MDTAMFEMNKHLHPRALLMSHAAEVAQWAVVLIGWLWLAEKGTLLAWPLLNGVLTVAIWWAMRIICRGSEWALKSKPKLLGLLGLLTTFGVAMVGRGNGLLLNQILVLCLAMVWGLWCAMIETRSQTSSFQMNVFAWHPLLAAFLVGLCQGAPFILLMVCTLVLYMHDAGLTKRRLICSGARAGFQFLLAPSAMGLMMGSLCFSQAWCASSDWSIAQVNGAHLALMAGLPSVLSYAMHSFEHSLRSSLVKYCTYVILSLQVLGTLMLWNESPIHLILAMLLHSLAWAVHCVRPRQKDGQKSRLAPRLKTILALLMGPMLLLFVGAASVMHGPMAIRCALALLGVLAGVRLVILTWRSPSWHFGMFVRG
jgi:hypothetical protein